MGSIVKITICKEYYIVLIQHEVYNTGKHCVHPQRLFKFGSREEPPVQRKSFCRSQDHLGRGGGQRITMERSIVYPPYPLVTTILSRSLRKITLRTKITIRMQVMWMKTWINKKIINSFHIDDKLIQIDTN